MIAKNIKKVAEEESEADPNELKRETNLFGPTSEKPMKQIKGITASHSESIISHSDINL